MKKNRLIPLLAALLVIGVGVAWKLRHRATSKQVEYAETPAARGNLELTILSTGSVAPENRLEIKPPIAGRMEEVLVKEGERVKRGQTLAWMSSTERAAVTDAARARGPEELKRWEELYRPAPILAPLDGTIILRNIEPGQSFATSDALLVMSDRLTVKAQVDETDIAQVHLKQRARIVLDAYPGKPIPARVDQVAFDAKTVNNVTTYVVDVLPESAPPYMRSGMTANVSFFVEAKENVILVNSDAMRSRDGRAFVLVKRPDGQAPEERTVETGASDGKRIEIVSGLREGEIVLTPKLAADAFQANKSGVNPFMPSPPGGNRRGSGGGGNRR